MIPPIVSVEWLREHPEAVIADVRKTLGGPSRRDDWLAGHLPGAVFVELDEVLAAPATAEGGRHPLPAPESFAAAMGELGIGDGDTVVAYDDAGGAFAGRLVWMLRNLGRDAALLDGGVKAWGGELESGPVERPAATFTPRPWDDSAMATIDDACTEPLVIDARAPERYRGDVEPLDPRAGHIPGAINVPFAGNLVKGGRFLDPEQLRARFEAAGVTDAGQAIAYCGSGVTACHNVLAMEYAGLGVARLFPGSWSQYAATDRPAATGESPSGGPATVG